MKNKINLNFGTQALYFCVPFREQLLEYYANNKSAVEGEDNLLTCLADLFTQVTSVPVYIYQHDCTNLTTKINVTILLMTILFKHE
jgi:hypothetical protein